MPRVARTVFAGVPHHVTQRGNRRGNVFFTDRDRVTYLYWLKGYCERYGVDILAYCLMKNHVHVVAMPRTTQSFEAAFRPLHMRYAQRVNRERNWHGHLWQGRFFSSPLDEDYLWAAIRYVERNPVRARMVKKAENYSWSSAAAHCGRGEDLLLTNARAWSRELGRVADWSAWLAEGDEPESLDVLRRNINKGLPCGSPKFIRRLEKAAGRVLRYRPRGRPRKEE
jgi:putative transposase